jgi:hypothetical protein
MRILRLASLRGIGLLLTATIALAACGGGSHTIPAPGGGSAGASNLTSQATFVISVPKQGSSTSDKRSPRYISAATQSIKVNVTQANGSPVTLTPVVSNVSGCPTDPANTGNFKCTVSAAVPIGTDTLSIGTYDQPNAGGNLISQQFTTVTVLQGVANGPPAAGYTFTLDANPSTINISPPGSGVTGSVGSGFTVNGSSALTFTATVNDAHGTTLTNNAIPGSPVLSATSSAPGVAAITSTSQNPYSITITPGGSSGTATITVKASPANAGDGLTFSQVQFNVSSVPTLVAVGGCAASSCEIDMYTMSGVNFTHYGTISGSGIGSYSAAVLGFDTTNRLYMYDNNFDVILEYPFSQLQALNQSNTQPPLPTAITNGINSNTSASMYSTFEVAPDGTMAVANPIGNLDQLVKFSPTATTYSLGRTFPGPTPSGQLGYWYRGFAVSVLTTTTGTPFGYAAALLSDNGAASNFNTATSLDGPSEIAVLSAPGTIMGGTTTTCDPGPISCEETDLTNNALSINEIQPPTMVWDPADQKLVVANNDTGVITQTPYSGGAFGAPTTIGSTFPVSFHILMSVSRDGHLAVAASDLNNTYVTIYDQNRNVVPGWNAKTFAAWTFDSIAFLADNSLLIAGGPSIPYNYLEHFLLTNTTTTPDATVQITGATLGLGDVSVSGQSHQRRVLGRRHFLSLPGMPH